MTSLQDLFDAFTLERMLTKFTWINTSDNLDENEGLNYISQKFQKIFLGLNKLKNETEMIEIDIKAIYDKYCTSTKKPFEENEISKNASPKYLDYQDKRLFDTPTDLYDLILDEEKINHKCFISMGENYICFDSNFEQLTLIMSVLETTIEFSPLLESNSNYTISTQHIIPKFSTHSFIFSFNLSIGLPNMFKVKSDKGIILDIIATLSDPNIIADDGRFPLSGYNGIYISLVGSNNKDIVIKFEVTEVFTKGSLLLDSGSIQKTSLFFLDIILGRLLAYDDDESENLTTLREQLKIYIT